MYSPLVVALISRIALNKSFAAVSKPEFMTRTGAFGDGLCKVKVKAPVASVSVKGSPSSNMPSLSKS